MTDFFLTALFLLFLWLWTRTCQSKRDTDALRNEVDRLFELDDVRNSQIEATDDLARARYALLGTRHETLKTEVSSLTKKAGS